MRIKTKDVIDLGAITNELVALDPDLQMDAYFYCGKLRYSYYSNKIIVNDFVMQKTNDRSVSQITFTLFKKIIISSKEYSVFTPRNFFARLRRTGDGCSIRIGWEGTKKDFKNEDIKNIDKETFNKIESLIIEWIMPKLNQYGFKSISYYCSNNIKEQIETTLMLI